MASVTELPPDTLAATPSRRRPINTPDEFSPSYAVSSPGQLPSEDANGVEGAPVRRRRPVDGGPSSSPNGYFAQPPAPDLPRAPPVSYRAPPITNSPYSTSFAERARQLTGWSDLPNFPVADLPPVDQGTKKERRTSLNRPIGGVYAEIQKHKRDSQTSTGSGPTSPRRSSFTPRTQPTQPYEGTPIAVEQPSPVQALPLEASPPSSQSTAIRRSPLTERASERAPRKEWASDRSPLQKLEVKLGDISKEEKRARVQLAEERLRRSRGESDHPPRTVSGSKEATQTGINAGQIGRRDSTRRAPLQDVESKLPRPSSTSVKPNQSAQGVADSAIPSGTIRREQSGRTDSATRRNSNRGTTRSASLKEPSKGSFAERAQQSDRGVRFQPSEIEDTDTSRQGQTKQAALEQLDLDPASAEARAARRDQLRQADAMPASRSRPRDAPPEQGNLYQERASPEGKAAQPRQFPTQSGKVDAADGVSRSNSHRHHLSSLLHRRQNRNEETQNTTELPSSEVLEEWRQAGVARLLTADFREEERSDKSDQDPWWEKGGSGRRRRSQRNSRATSIDLGFEKPAYQGNTGKTDSSSQPEPSTAQAIATPSILSTAPVRPYAEFENTAQDGHGTRSGLRGHASQFVSQLRRIKDVDYSSVYTYSCPDLALHSPSHPKHICEPYLSRELMMTMRAIHVRTVPGSTTFNPPLYLKCGPLLRYTGMKRDKLEGLQGVATERETWRGSILIVTADASSSYEPAPVLRLFPEPMDRVPARPEKLDPDDRNEIPSEVIEPIAGLPKLSRTGTTIYVKPVDDLEEAVDLSRVENDDGLFEETRTAAVPTSYGTPDYHPDRNSTQSANGSTRRQASRKPMRGHRVRGIRLHTERGSTFWRFNIEIELQAEETRVAYSINDGPAIGFWIPARGQSMNVMFHSCNGFSLSVDPNDFSGPDPLWRDVLNSHQARPFHVMIGGGDQIYNDAVMQQSPMLRDWLDLKSSHSKETFDFSAAMRDELETFYLERYSMWFSQGLFGMANSQIPMVNIWDDHDIIDGFGSYPDHFMKTPVFSGVGAVAFKYYMLFQHQSVPAETAAEEPSWLLGASPGPYIHEHSRSLFLALGKHVSFLGLDCRTERTRDSIVSEETYHLVLDRCRRELVKGETKHLILLLGVPIAYPRLVWLENLLTSRVMDPVKALGRVGLFGNFLNKFDGGVEILDDLDDHWTARNHKQERNWFIEELQELAAELSVRVTILGGDVHLAAIGQFFSHPKLKIPKDRDHRYMANIISSAIVNTPPPEVMGDILNKRNKTHHFDPDTEENMIPMFTHDVDGKFRNNKRLLPRRNWCSIREYHPGSTPPPTPPPSEPETESDEEEARPTGVRIRRTMSLTRDDVKPGNLIRRLSGRGPPSSYVPPAGERPAQQQPSAENDVQPFKPRPSPQSSILPSAEQSPGPLQRPGHFHRMPTNMSERAVLKGGTTTSKDHINLQHGLDIVLNCEVNQRDPSGTTMPYRLLVPALWYEGPQDLNTLSLRRQSVLTRFNSFRERRLSRVSQDRRASGAVSDMDSAAVSEDEEAVEEVRPRRWSFGLTQRRQYRDQTPPGQRESLDGTYDIDDHAGPRSQQQRRYEDRSQQIGKTDSNGVQQGPIPLRASVSAPDRAAANRARQQAFNKLTNQRNPLGLDGAADEGSVTSTLRRDSADYHEHIESGRVQATSPTSRPTMRQQPVDNGGALQGRRLSKVDRMLGVSGEDHAGSSSTAMAANASRNPKSGGIGGVVAPRRPSLLSRSASTGHVEAALRRSSLFADRIRRRLSVSRRDGHGHGDGGDDFSDDYTSDSEEYHSSDGEGTGGYLSDHDDDDQVSASEERGKRGSWRRGVKDFGRRVSGGGW